MLIPNRYCDPDHRRRWGNLPRLISRPGDLVPGPRGHVQVHRLPGIEEHGCDVRRNRAVLPSTGPCDPDVITNGMARALTSSRVPSVATTSGTIRWSGSTGATPLWVLSYVDWRQTELPGSHTWGKGQSLEDVQPTQLPRVRSQKRLGAWHCPSRTQATQCLRDGSQNGVSPIQSPSSAHSAHIPCSVSQVSWSVEHWEDDKHVSIHRRVVGSQMYPGLQSCPTPH
jgi:hypothetical protein